MPLLIVIVLLLASYASLSAPSLSETEAMERTVRTECAAQRHSE